MKVILRLLLASCLLIQSEILEASGVESEWALVRQGTETGQEGRTPQPPGSPEAVDTRAEQLEQRRLQKFQRIEPYHQGGLEAGLLWVEENLETLIHLNYHGFYPQFGSLSSGSGLSVGIRYWEEDLMGSTLDSQALAAFSLRGYQQYEFQFGRIPQAEPTLMLRAVRPKSIFLLDQAPKGVREPFFYGDLRFRDFPQEDFFGIGPASREEDRTDFELEDTSYDLVAGYQFARWFRVGVRFGFLQTDLGRGTDDRFPDTQELFDEASAPGLTEQPDFILVNPSVLFDYRDAPGNPHNGGLIGFAFTRFDDRDHNRFDFNRFTFDVRHYLPLGSSHRILAARFFTSLDDADAGDQVPFYLQETLGGSDTLRGFREFRFRDTNLLYLSAEYRWEAAPALELAFFYDTGKVFSDRSDFNLEDLKDSFGIGIRLKAPSAVVFRLDVGHGDEGTRVHFKFGSSF